MTTQTNNTTNTSTVGGSKTCIHQVDDPNWTKEDTDALWKLCKEFDVRFVVVHDRFPNPNKTIEDLKERYYGIMKKLVEINALPGEEVSKHPLVKFNFNRKHEEQR